MPRVSRAALSEGELLRLYSGPSPRLAWQATFGHLTEIAMHTDGRAVVVGDAQGRIIEMSIISGVWHSRDFAQPVRINDHDASIRSVWIPDLTQISSELRLSDLRYREFSGGSYVVAAGFDPVQRQWYVGYPRLLTTSSIFSLDDVGIRIDSLVASWLARWFPVMASVNSARFKAFVRSIYLAGFDHGNQGIVSELAIPFFDVETETEEAE